MYPRNDYYKNIFNVCKVNYLCRNTIFRKLLPLFVAIEILFFYTQTISAQESNLTFDHFTTKEGLSNNSINFIFKDSKGFMWFCTDAGLNRYDGYSFINFTYNSNDSKTISDNKVTTICEDKNYTFWVGTRNGLNLFDPLTHKFTRYDLRKSSANDDYYNWVQQIIPCKAGGIWIGSRSGLYRINQQSFTPSWIKKNNMKSFLYQNKNLKMVHYKKYNDDVQSLNDDRLYCLYEDKKGILWIGSDNGGSVRGALHKLLPGKNNEYPPSFKKYVHDINNPEHSVGKYIMSIYEDRYGNLWMGTWNQGLIRFKISDEKATSFTTKNSGINSNNVYSIIEDAYGDLWIATYGGGLNKIPADQLNSQNPNFINYKADPEEHNAIIFNYLRPLYLDSDNQLWIGSLGNGFYRTYINKSYTLFKHEPGNSSSLSDSRIRFIYRDSKGTLWLATKDGVLNEFHKKSKTFLHYNILKTKGVDDIYFSSIVEYENNLLLTVEDRIFRFNLLTKQITDFLSEINFPDSLRKLHSQFHFIYVDENKNLLISNTNYVLQIRKNNTAYSFKIYPGKPIFHLGFRDSKNNIWLTMHFNGLYLFNSKYDEIKRITYPRPDWNNFYGFTETKDGFLWSSTSKGLLQYNLNNGKFIYYEEQDGLKSNECRGILSDEQGNIWLSTNVGLSKFNPANKQVINLDEKNGLPISEFSKRVYCKGKDGEFYFGSDDGVLVFNPEKVKFKLKAPKVFITNLKIFNNEVRIGEYFESEQVLNKDIAFTEEIKLSHKSNVLYFEFTALNYLLSEKNNYAYKLEGIDKDWNYVNSERRFATYAGLPYGEYDFKVKASNNDGYWNEKGIVLKIIILPPWWSTWWFRSITIFLLLGALLSFYKIRTTQLRKRAFQLEELVEKRTREMRAEKEKAEIANKAKSNFLAKMSHELRTPLNAILGYSQILKKQNLSDKQLDQIAIIQNSGEHLLALIDDILNIAQIESQREVLVNKEFNLHLLIHEVINFTRVKALENNLTLNYEETTLLPEMVKGDAKKLRQILINLLNNSIKFTSEGGVYLKAKCTEIKNEEINNKKIKILFEVKDSGVGIPSDKLDKIFEPFMHSDLKTKPVEGIGLGLSICKTLVEMMHGSISVESKVGKGSTFKFDIELEVVEKDFMKRYEIEEPITGYSGNRKHILITDDNPYNMKLLISILEPLGFEIGFASTGVEALDYIEKNSPDLVLLDFLMPVMDGHSLINKLKTGKSIKTKIIGISAAIADKERVDAFASDCDSFISKPFHLKELLEKIKTQLGITWTMSTVADISEEEHIEPQKIPPKEILDQIITLTEMGDFTGIENILSELKDNISYKLFYDRIKSYSDQYNDEAIVNYITEVTQK